MATFFLKREIKAIKLASLATNLKLITENPFLGYLGYVSGGKLEPDQRFDLSFLQMKEKFIKDDLHRSSTMKTLGSFFFQFEDDLTDWEIFSILSFFSFFNLFRSDFFSIFSLPNSWDDILSHSFSGHIQQIGFPKEIFSANKFNLYTSMFTFLMGVLRFLIVEGSFWVARPAITLQKLFNETREQVLSHIDFIFQSFLKPISFSGAFLIRK